MAALSVFVALLLLHRRRVNAAALACVGLHPLVIVYAVGGGHMDPMVGLAVLAAVLLVMSGRVRWAAVAIACGILVKAVAAIAALALLVWLWSRRDARDPTRRAVGATRDAVTFAVVSGVVLLVGYLAAGGTSALQPLLAHRNDVTWPSLWAVVRGSGTGTPLERVSGLGATLLVLAVSVLVLRRHRRAAVVAVAVTGVLLAYMVGSGYVLVWYLVWLLPVAMLAWRTFTSLAALAYSAAILGASSWHPDPREVVERVLLSDARGIHLMAVVTIVALVAVSLYGSRSSRPDAAAGGARAP